MKCTVHFRKYPCKLDPNTLADTLYLSGRSLDSRVVPTVAGIRTAGGAISRSSLDEVSLIAAVSEECGRASAIS